MFHSQEGNDEKSSLYNPLVILAGCTHQDENVIKIGAAGPMTGDQSKMGVDLRNAVELAVDEWNMRGGVLGKKIVMLAGDDQADPKQAVSMANKFINQKAVAVVGHWNSSCSIPASKYYNDANIVMISPVTTNPQLTLQGFKKVFRVCGTDDQQGRVAAEFLLTRLHPKRVAIIHDKTAYGQGLADYFKKALGEKVQVVYFGGIVQRDPDYKAVLTTIRNAQTGCVFLRRYLSRSWKARASGKGDRNDYPDGNRRRGLRPHFHQYCR